MAVPLQNSTNEQIGLRYEQAELNMHCFLALYKSSFTPGPANVLADFLANEVNFTGYAEIDIHAGPWVSGFDDAGNVIYTTSTTFSFVQSGTGAIDTAGGWFAVDVGGAATKLLGYAPFIAPFPFNKVGNTAQVNPRWLFTCQGDGDVGTIVGP